MEAVFKGASQILATLSGHIALITLPLTRTLELKHVQLVRVDVGQIMMIVVMDTYETQSVIMPLPQNESAPDEELLEQELRILSNFLNEKLRGRSLSQLQTLDWRDVGQEFEVYSSLLTSLMQELDRRFTQSLIPTQMMVSGIADVLKQPEFAELQQLQTILHLLEGEQNQLVPLIFDPPQEGDRRVTIRIGHENTLEPIRACTLISTHYNRKSMPIGSVSILGPTRMDYESTIALVEATADYLSDRLS